MENNTKEDTPDRPLLESGPGNINELVMVIFLVPRILHNLKVRSRGKILWG